MKEKRGEQGDSSKKDAALTKKMLGDLTHKKISYYLTKNKVTDSDLYNVFKEFFSELLEIKYEYTCSELEQLTSKIYLETPTREKLSELIKKISLIEYKDNTMDEEEVKKLLQDLDSLVINIIKLNTQEKKGFLSSLKDVFKKKSQEKKTTKEILYLTDEIRKDISPKNQEPVIPSIPSTPSSILEKATTNKNPEKNKPEIPEISETQKNMEFSIDEKLLDADEDFEPRDDEVTYNEVVQHLDSLGASKPEPDKELGKEWMNDITNESATIKISSVEQNKGWTEEVKEIKKPAEEIPRKENITLQEQIKTQAAEQKKPNPPEAKAKQEPKSKEQTKKTEIKKIQKTKETKPEKKDKKAEIQKEQKPEKNKKDEKKNTEKIITPLESSEKLKELTEKYKNLKQVETKKYYDEIHSIHEKIKKMT